MKIYNDIKLAQELIRFPTVKTEDRGIMKFLSKKLGDIGFKCKIIKSKGTGPKPALNLYARFGRTKPHINFLGHTDVVANLNNWKIPPFKAIVKKGYLNGRGSQDMKGGIACWISAMSDFIKNNRFKGSISIINTLTKKRLAKVVSNMKYLKKGENRFYCCGRAIIK